MEIFINGRRPTDPAPQFLEHKVEFQELLHSELPQQITITLWLPITLDAAAATAQSAESARGLLQRALSALGG
jgi:hypothetical protein